MGKDSERQLLLEEGTADSMVEQRGERQKLGRNSRSGGKDREQAVTG